MATPSPLTPAGRWAESGWLDVEFYGALRGRRFRDVAEAAEDFVDHGMPALLSPHPFVHYVDQSPRTQRAWRNGRTRRVLADLDSASPVAAHLAPRDPSARARMLALASALGRESAGEAESGVPSIDWAAVAGRTRRPAGTSVVVVAADLRATIRTVRRVLDLADGDVEVLVVDAASPPDVALGLHAVLLDLPEVECIRVSGRVADSDATNLGVARATGETALLLEPQVVLRRGALAALLAVLEDPAVAGVQPVVLGPDDTIVSAGLVVLAGGTAPVRVLAGHQADDARRLDGQPLAALSPEAVALRVEDVAAVGGLESDLVRAEALVDLCARLGARRPGGFRVAPAARVTLLASSDSGALSPHPLIPPDPGLSARIGFETGAGGSLLVIGRRPAHPGQRRWSLKLPSPPGRLGDVWGDTHFADALAAALRDLGEDVVTCRRGAHAAGPTQLDDVALALRGLYAVPPIPGPVNVMWVISHPDDVDASEFEGYDLVFAASEPWSAALSARTGREVHPLLQASGFEPPDSALGEPAPEPEVVFVGNAGDRDRPLVWTALEAGVPLAVYGRGWGELPQGVWRAGWVDNRRLPELYRRHGIVLADHWPDMARQGFIANRVFDAVASGARVVCDDVLGVHDVFDPRDVVVVRDADEIRRAVAELRGSVRGDDVPRPTLTFHDRARALIDAVARG